MGFFDRLGKVATGFGGAIQAPFGLVKDIAGGMFTDVEGEDDYNDFVSFMWHRTIHRGTQFLENELGPNEGLGALIGGLPSPVRQPGKHVVLPVLNGFETVYREGISEPITTLMTVGSLADRPGGPGPAALLDPEAWRTAYAIAQSRSPGQSILLAAGTKDILDEKEVEQFQGTDWYEIGSGLTDALIRWKLDPMMLTGKALKFGKVKYFDRPFDEGMYSKSLRGKFGLTDEEAANLAMHSRRTHMQVYFGGERWGKVNAHLEGLRDLPVTQRASRVRDEFFPNMAHGDHLSVLLASADDAVEREAVMRVFLGDLTALEATQASNAALHSRLTRLVEDRAMIKDKMFSRDWHRSTVYRNEKKIAGIEAEIDEVEAALESGKKLESVWRIGDGVKGGLPEPRVHWGGQARSALKRSVFVQTHPVLKPVRVFANMTPHRFIDVTDPMADVQVDRFARTAGLLPGERDAVRGRFMKANPAERAQIMLEIEEQGFRKLGKQYGMNREQIRRVLNGATHYRLKSMQLLKESRYDGKGRTLLRFEDEGELVDWPIVTGQVSTTFPTVDFNLVRREMRPVRQVMRKYGATAVADMPTEAFTSLMKLWRPAVLLRPAWAIRVVGDEQLRMIAKIGALTDPLAQKTIKQAAPFRNGVRNYFVRASKELGLGWGGSTAGIFGGVVGGPAGALAGASIGVLLQKGLRTLDEIPYAQLTVQGYTASGAFGTRQDQIRAWEERVSARDGLQEAIGQNEAGILANMKTDPGSWETKRPGDAGYAGDYEKVANMTGADPLVKAYVGGMTDELAARQGKVVYHGTVNAETGIQPIGFGDYPGIDQELGDAMYFTTSPEAASRFSTYRLDGPGSGAMVGSSPGVYRVELDPNMKFIDVQAKLPPAVRKYMEDRVQIIRDDLEISGGFDLDEIPGEVATWQRILKSDNPEAAVGEFARLLGPEEHAQFVDAMGDLGYGGFVQPRARASWGDDTPTEFVAYAVWRPTDMLHIPDHSQAAINPGARNRALTWLTSTAEGRAHLKTNPVRAANPESWVDTLADIVDDLTVRDAGVAAKMIDDNHKLTHAEMAAVQPDLEAQPWVHGQQAYQVLGRSQIGDAVHNMVENAFKAFGTIPTDVLSRNRYFAFVYRHEMESKLAGVAESRISKETLNAWEESARQTALTETKKLLYDMAERSEFAEMMRNIMPFYSAWQEVLTRWAGLLVENPEMAARAHLLSMIPSHTDMGYTDPETGEKLVRFRLPSFAKGLVGHGFLKDAFDSQGYVELDPKALNMVASGLPGFGPLVTTALLPVIKNNPKMEESLKFIYPFGVPRDVMDAVLPGNIKKLTMVAGEDEAAAFQSARNRILLTKLVEMQQGHRGEIDMDDPVARGAFLAEVEEEAQAFVRMRFGLGLVAPLPVNFDSPYAPMLEAYRERRNKDPEGADEWFLDQYGEEYFALTQAFTKVNDGIPPTLPAEEARAKYVDMVERFPELGSLIIGSEGGGSEVQFSSAVYNKQLGDSVREGSSEERRSRLSPEDIALEPDVRLGWIKFSRMMDTLESMQIAMGLPNLFVKEATNLRMMRTFAVTKLAQEHPQWFIEYSTRDESKWSRKIVGMKEIVSDERLVGRPDIAGLKDYLGARDVMIGMLQAREQKSLTAQANQDLRIMWETYVMSIKERNLAFSDLYNRWLVNDPLSAPGPLEQAEAA